MKNEAPKYFKNLEERWKINKAESERSQDDDGLLRRPKGLRASELVRELWRLYALWQDPRFKACSQALFEHEIVQGLDGDWVDGEKLLEVEIHQPRGPDPRFREAGSQSR